MKRLSGIFFVLAMGSFVFYGCKKDLVDTSSAKSVSEDAASAGQENSGAVYVLSNATSGNQVLVYNRSSNGSLSAGSSYATGGNGTGAGLGSQGSVIFGEQGGERYLFAVNA